MFSSLLACILDLGGGFCLSIGPVAVIEPLLTKQLLAKEIFFLVCNSLYSLKLPHFDIFTGLPYKPEYLFGPRFYNGSTACYHILGSQFDKILVCGDQLMGGKIFISKNPHDAAKHYFINYFSKGLDTLIPTSTKAADLLKVKEGLLLNESIFGKLFESKYNIKLMKIKQATGSFGDFKFNLSEDVFGSKIRKGLPELVEKNTGEVFLELKTANKEVTKEYILDQCKRYNDKMLSPEVQNFGICVDASAGSYGKMFELRDFDIELKISAGSFIDFTSMR